MRYLLAAMICGLPTNLILLVLISTISDVLNFFVREVRMMFLWSEWRHLDNIGRFDDAFCFHLLSDRERKFIRFRRCWFWCRRRGCSDRSVFRSELSDFVLFFGFYFLLRHFRFLTNMELCIRNSNILLDGPVGVTFWPTYNFIFTLFQTFLLSSSRCITLTRVVMILRHLWIFPIKSQSGPFPMNSQC